MSETLRFWKVFAVALIVSCGTSFHYGYQLSVVNPTENEFRIFINESHLAHYGYEVTAEHFVYLWPIIVNLQNAGGLVGTFFIQLMLEGLGRKKSLYVTTFAMLTSCLIQGISKQANSYELFAVGRFITGIVVGITCGIQPVYLNEISPTKMRGKVSSLTGAFVELGFFICSVLALPDILGTADGWPYLLAVEAAFSVPLAFILLFLPESPKFLASRGNYKDARDALQWFGNTADEAEAEIKDIRKELYATSKDAFSIRAIFTTPYTRRGVLLGWMLILTSGFTGIIALSYFSSKILESGGLTPTEADYGTVAVTGLCFVAAFIGGFTTDKLGRRPILIATYSVMLVQNIFLLLLAHLNRVYGVKWAGYANIAMAASLSFVYGFGPAVIMWFLTGEMVPQSARAAAQLLAMIVQWSGSLMATMVFYLLHEKIQEFCFLVHILPLLAGICVFYFYLPETKNKETIEIMRKLGFDGKVKEADDEIELNRTA